MVWAIYSTKNMDIQALIAENESVWIDFKRDFHTNTAKLLHDILCLSNSHYDGDRFIIFGVKNDKTIYGIEADPNRKTNADLHDFLRQANLNKIPQIELTFYQLEGHEIGLLRIKNQAFKPYFVRKDFIKDKFCVRGGVVYTRLGDTNIPSNETAPEDHIERMWRERVEYKNFKDLSFEERFPIKLNDSMEHVLEVLGEPDATGWQIAHYYSEGIELSFDQHFDFVEGISIYHLPTGTAFEGTLLGIKLGDSFSSVKEKLGKPALWGLAYAKGTMAVWEFDDKLFMITIWSNKNKDNTIPFQQLGTVNTISYSNQKSFVGYNILVVRAINQIREGKIPKEFEREDILIDNIDLDSSLFHQEYELLGAQQALMGGAEVWIGFPETKEVVAFWVYPLRWQFPVIRAIYKLQPNQDLENSESTNED